MSLLNTPFTYDESLIEGSVTNVDPGRNVCVVKTIKGQYLRDVIQLMASGGSGNSGMQSLPSVGDRVVISTALTYPVIIGFLPRLGRRDNSLTTMTGTSSGVDTGNDTNLKNGFSLNPNRPPDLLPGDMAITSTSGATVATLANGSVIARASALAQVFLSRFNDLVRVVGRNWERFSDVGQQTASNIKGRLYEYCGWDRKLQRSKLGVYELNEVFGDVVAGETLKGEPNTQTVLGAADDRIHKVWLTNQNGQDLMVEILQDNGKITVTVQDVIATTKTVEQHDKNLYDVKTQIPGKYSQVTIVPGSITLNHNAVGTVVLDDNGIRSDYGGHFVYVDSSGVHMG